MKNNPMGWKDPTMNDIVTQEQKLLTVNPVEVDYIPGVADRMMLVIDKLLILFKMGVMEKRIARGFIEMFAKQADDEQIVQAIRMAQQEIIPFIMTGELDGSDQDIAG